MTASCSGYELNCVVGGPPVRRLEQRLCETGGKEHFIASRSLMTVPVIVDRWMAQAIHPVQQHTQGIRQGHAMQEGGRRAGPDSPQSWLPDCTLGDLPSGIGLSQAAIHWL